jgi:hypothetical protein
MTAEFTIKIEDESKPTLIAECLTLFHVGSETVPNLQVSEIGRVNHGA